MMKKELFKSVFWSFSFASLVFAFQNCSSHNQDAFVSNVKPRAASKTMPVATESLIQKTAQ